LQLFDVKAKWLSTKNFDSYIFRLSTHTASQFHHCSVTWH